MKFITHKIVTTLLFSLLANISVAQNFQITFDSLSSTLSFNACSNGEEFVYNVSNIGLSYGDTIFVIVDVEQGVIFDDLLSVQYDTLSPFDPAHPVFYTLPPFASNTTRKLRYTQKAICGAIESDGSNDATDIATVSFNKDLSGQMDQAQAQYIISTPVLNFGSFPIQTTLIGDVVQRDITVSNTNNTVDINGNFIITDDYGISLRVDSAAVISGNVTNFSYQVDNTGKIAVYQGSMQLDNSNSTFIIREFIIVDSCLFADNNTGGNSRIALRYGCSADDTCATYSTINPSTANAIITHPTNPSPAPLIQVSGYRGKDTTTCTQSALTRAWIITNNGTSPAVNMTLQLRDVAVRDFVSYTYVDAASISATLNGAALTDSTTLMDNFYSLTTHINTKSCYDAAGHEGIHDAWFTIPELNVGDTIMLNFTEYRCCPDAPGTFGNWLARLHYGTACDPHPVSPARVDYISIPYEFKVTQEFNNYTANMFGDTHSIDRIDTNLFIIDNIDANFSSYGLTHPTLPLDTNNACFVVEIALDTGLYLVENFDPLGDLYITSPVGFYLPQSLEIDTILGTGNDYYTIVTARFCPPAAFWERDNIKDFFSSSSITFNLTARCSPHPPGQSFIDHTLYLDLDTNCTDDCLIPAAFSSSFVQVQCPGCLIPGSLVGGATILRTNVGLEDANNNHLADNQVTPASNAELRNAVEGDTVENSFNIIFFDGQPDMGGWTYQQLQDTFGIAFTHALVKKTYSDANFRLINADIEIFDVSQAITYSGTFVPREVNWGNLQGLDFNIATLLNEGIIDANYTDFNVEDEINIVLRLHVVKQSHPDEGTVVELTNFFFTASDSVFLNDAVELDSLGLDTTILDSTYFFWCESRTARVRLFDHELNIVNLDNFSDNIGNDWCVKRVPVSSSYKVGAAGPNSDNLEFEYRHFTEVDRVEFIMPPGYGFVDASWHNTNDIRIPANALTTTQTNKVIEGIQPDTIMGDTLIFYAQQYFRDTAFFSNSFPYLLHGDESMVLRLYVFISPICGEAVDGEKRLEAFTYFDHPGLGIEEDSVRQHLITNLLNPGLTLPDPDLVRTPNDPSGFTVTISQSDVCIPFSILNNTGGSENFNAQNTFVFLDSAFLEVVSNPTIFNQTDNDTIFPDSNGFYRLGNLGAGEAKQLLICGQSAIECDSDTTLANIYSGWSCIDYPTQFGSSICGVDSTGYKLIPTEANIVAELLALDSTILCDTVPMRFTATAVGIGSVYEITNALNLPTGLEPVDTFSRVIFNGDTIIHPHQFVGGKLTWQMDSIDDYFISPGFNSGDPLRSTYQILVAMRQVGCANVNLVNMDLMSTQYCGDLLNTNAPIVPQFNNVIAEFNTIEGNCDSTGKNYFFVSQNGSAVLSHQWFLNDTLVSQLSAFGRSLPVGTHQITYILSNNVCCSDTSIQYVTVDSNACCELFSYDSTIGTAGTTLFITSDVSLPIGDYLVRGMIVVDNGARLTLEPGVVLHWESNPDAWVLPNPPSIGQVDGMYLRNGSTLEMVGATITTACGDLWYGVFGDDNSQNLFTTRRGSPDDFTTLSSQISHSFEGVQLRNGKFKVRDTRFYNNLNTSLGIYKPYAGTPGREYVKSCTFTSDPNDWVLPGFITNIPDYNPAGEIYPNAHITLEGRTSSVRIGGQNGQQQGNVFEKAFYGIYSAEALSFTIQGNTFQDHWIEAVQQWGWAGLESSLRDNTIYLPASIPVPYRSGYLNLGVDGAYGTTVSGVTVGNARVEGNTFIGNQYTPKSFTQAGLRYEPGWGAYFGDPLTLDMVKGNTFIGLNRGIKLYPDGTSEAQLIENNMTDCKVGIEVADVLFGGAPLPTGTFIGCNTFENGLWATATGIYVENGAFMNDNGSCGGQPAGNLFLTNSGTMATLDNDGIYTFQYSGYADEIIAGGNLSINNIVGISCGFGSGPNSCRDNGIGSKSNSLSSTIADFMQDLIANTDPVDMQNKKMRKVLEHYAMLPNVDLAMQADRLLPSNARAYCLMGGTVISRSIREEDAITARAWLDKLEAAEPQNDGWQHYVQMTRLLINVTGLENGQPYILTANDVTTLHTIAASGTPFYNQKACELLQMRGYNCAGVGTSHQVSTPSVAQQGVTEAVRLEVAPNPTHNSTSLSLVYAAAPSVEETESLQVSIYDMKGTLVKQAILSEASTVELQKAEVGYGVFFAVLSNKNAVLDRQKIIILK